MDSFPVSRQIKLHEPHNSFNWKLWRNNKLKLPQWWTKMIRLEDHKSKELEAVNALPSLEATLLRKGISRFVCLKFFSKSFYSSFFSLSLVVWSLKMKSWYLNHRSSCLTPPWFSEILRDLFPWVISLVSAFHVDFTSKFVPSMEFPGFMTHDD